MSRQRGMTIQPYRSTGSLNGSQDIVEFIQNSYFGKGICRTTPLSQTGKRLQLFKMLCLNVLPVLCLWGYTVYRLADSTDFRTEYQTRRTALYHSVDLGKLVHRLQVERDMSVLYLSIIGPETKAFLLAEYTKTDEILRQLNWPQDIDNKSNNLMFLSKANFEVYLNEHRRLLTPTANSIQNEIDFYSRSIETIINWLYSTITESKFSVVWRLIVAYQKLASAKENLGVERALGTMFYARGGFDSHSYFENYNERLHSFRAYMKSIGMYSVVVDEIYNSNVAKFPDNFTITITNFRDDIQSTTKNFTGDLRRARFFFDNMTLYLNTLFDVQTELANYVLATFNDVIDELTRELVINAVLLVVVILICPVVIFATESLTSNIQAYALILVDKTKELTTEKQRNDGLLFQMVPKQIAELLKRKEKVDAEYFKAVTISFSDIYEFDKLIVELAPLEIVHILDTLYNKVDEVLDDFDVYKVETINDCYMVASGLPKRNKDRHALAIAEFSLKIIQTVSDMNFLSRGKKITLRVGINSGPCMAGIVGLLMPRYCLFGDTVNTASRMKAYSQSNQIHISHSTYMFLKRFKRFTVKKRGSVSVKGKGQMCTYWLMGKVDDFGILEMDEDFDSLSAISSPVEIPGEITELKSFPMPGRPDQIVDPVNIVAADTHHGANKADLPGEITTIESPTYSASLNFPMPGRPHKAPGRVQTRMKKSVKKTSIQFEGEHIKSEVKESKETLPHSERPETSHSDNGVKLEMIS